jgi:hypothetical protein
MRLRAARSSDASCLRHLLQAKPPVAVVVSRSAATAEVTLTASDSPKKGKARGATAKPPNAAKVKDVWSFEEAFGVKPKAAEAPQRAEEPPAVPDSPLAVFEMVRGRHSTVSALWFCTAHVLMRQRRARRRFRL